MGIMIAPSILSADFSRLGDEITAVAEAGADVIHVDVMDGHFVPNLTIGPLVVEAIRPVTRLPLDVHLMIEAPDRYIDAFARAGASWITVHVEACTHLHRTIQKIKGLGIKAGAALNPATSPEAVQYCLDELDLILVMSVNPGFGGQHFIPSALKKTRTLRRMLSDRGLSVAIEIDGGINRETISSAAEAGVDIFVAGSAIFGSKDYKKAIQELRSLGDKVEKRCLNK